MKFRTILRLVICPLIAGIAGYALGVKRTEYLHARYQISTVLWSNAMLEAEDTKHHRTGNDIFIGTAYAYIARQPSWIALFSADRERDSDARIKDVANQLKASLDRSMANPPSEAEVDQFVRTYMGTHSTIQGSQKVVDAINKELEMERSGTKSIP